MKEKQISCAIFIQDVEIMNQLIDLLSKFKSIQVNDVLNNTFEAVETLSKKKISILFTDVDAMKKMQFLNRPHFIVGICDKKESRNLKKLLKSGFFDFLFTPIMENDFYSIMGKIFNIFNSYQTISKSEQYMAEENGYIYNMMSEQQKGFQESIVICGKSRNEKHRIPIEDLSFIKYQNNKCFLYYSNGSTKVYNKTIKYFSEILPELQFQRISRYIIVNVKKVSNLTRKWVVQVNNEFFNVTRSYRKSLKEKIKSE